MGQTRTLTLVHVVHSCELCVLLFTHCWTEHLKDMNKMIGTSADNKEHRVAIQKNIKGLLSDTVELVRDCVNVSLDKEMAQVCVCVCVCQEGGGGCRS